MPETMDGFVVGDRVTLLDISKNKGMEKFRQRIGKVGVIKRFSYSKETIGVQFPNDYELVYGFPWRFRKIYDFSNPDWEI